MDKIVKVKYYYYSGMMRGADFDIEISENEILYGLYCIKGERFEVTNKKYNTDLWKELVESIEVIFDLHKELPPYKPIPKFIEDHILDGGDRSGYELTFFDGEKEKTIKYCSVNDRRFNTVRQILQEALNPTGNKIIKYGPPYPIGLYYFKGKLDSNNYFSFQSTPIDLKEGNKRYLFSYWNKKDSRSNVSLTTDDYPWNVVYPLVKKYEPHKLKSSPRSEKFGFTLYFSDGQQITFIPDKKEIEVLENTFKELHLKYQKKGK